MAGKGAYRPLRGADLGEAAEFGRLDRDEAEIMTAGKASELQLPLLGLERACAIDERAAGLEERRRALEHAGLEVGQRADVPRPLQPRNVGVAADGSGCRAWRVEEDSIEQVRRRPTQQVAGDELGGELQPGKVGGKTFQAGGGNVDRGDARAGQRERRRLAARRGAEIGDPLAGHRTEEPRRQCGGGILHPPFAIRVTGQRLDRPRGNEPHGPVREHDAAEPFRPALRIALHGQVEAGLDEVRARDLAGSHFAVGRGPSRKEPVRRVDALGVVCGEKGIALTRQAAKHAVDQRLEMAGMAVGLGIGHGGRHRGIGGHVEKEDLRRRGFEDRCEPAGSRRHTPFHQAMQRGKDLPAAAERGGDDRARQRPVARLQSAKRRIAGHEIEQPVERSAVENALQKPRCRASRRDPGVGWAAGALARFDQPHGPFGRPPILPHGPT